MGTTLTGTTPATTYDSLIKVTDNGPLSGTAKYLSDGLGNDSALALSTAGLGVGTTSLSGKFHAQATNSGIFFDLTTAYTPKIKPSGAISDLQIESVGSGGNLVLGAGGASSIKQFFVNVNLGKGVRMRVTSAGNVGIGTSSPTTALSVNGAIQTTLGSGGVSLSGNGSPDLGYIGYNYYNVSGTETATLSARNSWRIKLGNGADKGVTFDYRAANAAAGTFTEYVRIQETGGISFNGDTAAANALDDYEEGTWTPIVTFGGNSVGQTYNANTGTYTKIGRQVTVTCYVEFTNKGTSTGSALLAGLPFTIGSGFGFFGAPCLGDVRNITFTDILSPYINYGQTTITLTETTNLGALTNLTQTDFANNSEFILTTTYFV